jgi:hypothetical protein
MSQSIKVVSSYIGAYPAGRPAPALDRVPACVNTLLLSFAKEDGRGVFKPNWDTSSSTAITPERIAADKAANGRRFLVSLAGDAIHFNPTVNMSTWVDNAFNSLCNMIDAYHLDGVDSNYENIDNPGIFVEALGQLFQRLSQKYPGSYYSIAPFNATWPLYRSLLQGKYGEYITWNNYQLYASGITDLSGNITALADIANQTGWETLVYGVCTNTSSQRGASPATALQVTAELKSKLAGDFTWSAEDSAMNDFSFETQAADILNS